MSPRSLYRRNSPEMDRIIRAHSGFYDVRRPDGTTLRCRARGKFRQTGLSPLVGDLAEVRLLEDGSGMIWDIAPRRNAFVRPAVANIDLMVMIASAAIPRTDPYLIDRMTAVAALKNCEAVVVFNKSDLAYPEDFSRIYGRSGIRSFSVSAETGEGIGNLIPLLSGKISAFTGNSGVGKSSILNALDPSCAISTGEVSEKLGRGRHTTRHVELYQLACGAQVVDTPGFSSFDSEELDLALKEHLAECFLEFRPFLGGCRFVGCSHTREKGCAVRRAVKDGVIPESRHASYVRLFNELKDLREWNQRK